MHYLAAFDEVAFAGDVVDGDVHTAKSERVGSTSSEVKSLVYGVIYGAGDVK